MTTGCSFKALVTASILYLVVALWTSNYLSVAQNMAWVYPALVAVLIANIVLKVFRYVRVAHRYVSLPFIAFMSWELIIALILVGTTGVSPRLVFDTWRPYIVFSRQMLVLSGVWMAWGFWYETFRMKRLLENGQD